MITPHAALNRLIDGNELFYDEMLSLMRQIMSGQVAATQIAAILIGLRVKVESVSEIAAAATVMREFATHVPVATTEGLVDTCGTGGDGAHTFNISTTAAFVAAAAGAKVAKHGGRSVSSSSGSADVLEALGVALTLSPAAVGQCIDQLGVGFMFAPNHHTAMKYVAPVRRELGVRTLFNILGPLTNPAHAPNQVMGVFHPDLVGIQCRVLKQLGSRHVLIVHGHDGLDEISLCAPTLIAELKNGEIEQYEFHPQSLGFELCSPNDLRADSAERSKAMLLAVLDNQASPARDIVLLNAAAALYVSGVATSLADGVARARDVLASGAAKQRLQALVDLSQSLAPRTE